MIDHGRGEHEGGCCHVAVRRHLMKISSCTLYHVIRAEHWAAKPIRQGPACCCALCAPPPICINVCSVLCVCCVCWCIIYTPSTRSTLTHTRTGYANAQTHTGPFTFIISHKSEERTWIYSTHALLILRGLSCETIAHKSGSKRADKVKRNATRNVQRAEPLPALYKRAK